MPCTEHISSTCDAGHKQSWKCGDRCPEICRKCKREAKLAKERQKQEMEAQERREIEEEREHLVRLDTINAKIAKECQAREDARLKLKENDLLTALIASRAELTVPPAPLVQASTLLTLRQMLPSPSNFFATASSMLSRLTDGALSNSATSESENNKSNAVP